MKFTTTLAVASLFSAVFVAAVPLRYEDDFEVVGRDFGDYEVDARSLGDYEVFDAREFEDELMLYLRTGFGQAVKKAAKDTADMAAKKVYKSTNSPGAHTNRPNFAQAHGLGGATKPPGHYGSSHGHSGKK